MRQILASLSLLLATASGAALVEWEAGVAAFEAGDYPKAVQEFRQVVEQSPEAHSGHYMLGLSLGRLGRAQESLEHLRRAYDLNPNDLGVRVALARAYFAERRYLDVTKLLDGVSEAELAPKLAQAIYQMRAVARERTGHPAGALEDYDRLTRMAPDDGEILLRYGVLLAGAANLEEALRVLERAQRVEPTNPEVLGTYGQLLKRRARLERDRQVKQQTYLDATEVAHRLVAVESTYESHLFACEVRLGARLYSEAIDSCQLALAKRSDQWLPLFYVGLALCSEDRCAEALEPLEQAAQFASDEDLDRVWRQIGFVHEKRKDYELAIEAYQRAGDEVGVARVTESEKISTMSAEIAVENELIEQEYQSLEQMRREAEELEEQLRELEEGPNR